MLLPYPTRETCDVVARPDDASLWLECQNGSESAWADLVGRYENLVYSTALQTGLDPEDAADVFQQVWLELHRSLLRIRDPKALPRWLIVTTRRIAYKHAIVAGRWVRETRDDMVDPAPGADAIVVVLEERQELEDALAALDERCEQLLRMFFYSEKKVTYKEVSERLGLSEDSIGSLRSRCLERLRRILGN
jgi:RNA polymerase sigma factor (sigma-70 family)